jgi:hypothetical protein
MGWQLHRGRYCNELKAGTLAKRSTMRKPPVALARLGSSRTRCCDGSWIRPPVLWIARLRPMRTLSRSRAATRHGGKWTARILLHEPTAVRLRFQPRRPHPAYPIKCRTSTQRTQAPESVDSRKNRPPRLVREQYPPVAVIHNASACGPAGSHLPIAIEQDFSLSIAPERLPPPH